MEAIAELPEELITAILSKLPVISLLQLKCVCKSYAVLENNKVLADMSFHSHETLTDLGIQIDTPFPKSFEIVSVSGPCNGLICISSHYDKMFICNPATREFRSLFVPPSPGYRSGYHIETCIMIMLTIFLHTTSIVVIGKLLCTILVLDSWSETGIVLPGPFDYKRKSVTFNGEYRDRDLYVLNKSLALIVYYCGGWIEISVMTEYGVKDSWARLVELGPLRGGEYFPFAIRSLKDEDMLLLEGANDDQSSIKDRHLISYGLQHQNVKHFPIYGWTSEIQTTFDVVFEYSESLVSVNSIGDVRNS
ncbi:hypothetical protein CASFOL_028971 [Castilleja foliolosa]|uniref:F-box domain-containing protein n=1 Tax=Castilleja foliolosa TaxID=1961234 RepID=A0ABD3CCP9_9LAMI